MFVQDFQLHVYTDNISRSTLTNMRDVIFKKLYQNSKFGLNESNNSEIGAQDIFLSRWCKNVCYKIDKYFALSTWKAMLFT